MITFSQRDILLVPFPFTDLSSTKQRPVLVVSNNKINHNRETPDFVGLAITSKIRKGLYNIQISDKDLDIGSLFTNSEIHCDKIATLEKELVIKKLCKIKTQVYSRVKTKLKDVFH